MKAVGAVGLGAALPAVATEISGEWFCIEPVMRAINLLKAQPKHEWYMVALHTDVVSDLTKSLTPKEKWKIAHRSERIRMRGYLEEVTASGELGSYQNVRFTVSR